jgi:hypothetical protein
MSPTCRIDPAKFFLKVMGKSATGNQSLTGEFQNGLRRPSAYEPVIPLPSAAAFPASGALFCWSLENCTGSERDRPRRHVPICPFGASPGEPQPSMAATNKCLAQSNKSLGGVSATKELNSRGGSCAGRTGPHEQARNFRAMNRGR